VNGYRRLAVVGRREHLRRLRRNRRVLLDQLRHHATERLDAERQRRHVEQQHVLALAGEHRCLDRGTDGNRLVGVDVLARLLAEERLHRFLHLRHPRHATDEDDVADVGQRNARVFHRDAARLDGALDQLGHQRLELRTRDLQRQVPRPRCVGRDVRQVDVRLLRRGQLDLRLLGRFLQSLQRQHVVLQVDALVLLELGDDVIDDPLIEVLAAEECVPVGRQHFELVLALDVGDLDDRDVERAAAKVVNGDLAVAFLLVETERQCRRRRLVDDPLDLEARDAAGILRRLPLRIVEIRRDGDDRLRHFLAEIVLGGLFHLAQDFRGHLLRRDLLAAHLDPRVAVVSLDDLVGHQADVLLHFLFFELASDEPLHREDRVLRIGHRLALRRRPDEHLAVVTIGDDRRRRARAFGILDDLGRAAFHDRDATVRRPEIDTDDLAHF